MLKKPTYEELVLRVKELEQEAEQHQIEKKWIQMINTIDEWYVLLDSNLKVIDINEPGLTVFFSGKDKKDVLGTKFSDFATDIKPRYDKFKEVIKTGLPYSEENIITSPQDTSEEYHINIKAIKIGDGVGVVAKNVTAQKQTEEKLRQSEEKFRSIFENANDEIVYVDMNGTFIDVNDKVEDIFGWKREECVGKNFLSFDALGPEGVQKNTELIEALLAGKPGYSIETEAFHKDGTPIFIEVNASLIKDNGEPGGFVVIIRDVTKQKQAEEALQDSEEKFKTIFKNANDQIMYLDIEGNVIDVNDKVEDIFGWTREECIGKNYSEFAPTSISTKVLKEATKLKDDLFSGLPGRTVTINAIRKDGDPVIVEVSGSLFEKDGEAKGIVNIIRDVTEREKAEKALKESEDQYRLLFDHAGPITYFDNDMKLILANKISVQELGAEELQNIKGMDMDTFFQRMPAEQVSMLKKRYKKILKSGKGDVFEDLVEFNRGKQWYITNTQPVKISKGKIIGFVIFANNISDRKKMEEELREKNIELEETNTALTVMLKKREADKREQEEKVLDNIKSLVLPYLEKVKSGKLSKRQESHLEIIENNINEVVSPFIHDISSGFYNLSPTEIQISNLIMQGLSTKEIAEIMSLSDKTIESHRKNIRKKTGILNKKVNLRTHLLSIQNK